MEAAQILDRVVARFIGTKHERDIKKLQPVVAAINAREAETQALSDGALKTHFAELRAQVQEQLKDARRLRNCLDVGRGDSCGRRIWRHERDLERRVGEANRFSGISCPRVVP